MFDALAARTLRHLNTGAGLPVKQLTAAVVVGAAAGYAGVAYHYLTDWIQRLSLGAAGDPTAALLAAPWYLILVIPAIGALLIAPIVWFMVPEARGTGAPEVMKAVIVDRGRIRGRVAAAKMVASSVTVGTGGSVGREGPIIQIGAALGSKLAQLLRWGPDDTISLVGAGAAAGIAGVFNAPIAGAFFALEVIIGNFAASLFAPIVLASVTATAVSRAHLGDFPAFQIPNYSLESGFEVPLYALMGVACGAVALLFMATLERTIATLDALPLPKFARSGLGGLALGALIIATPEVYGTGFSAITDILTQPQNAGWLAVLLVAKVFAVSITLASGGSGGVFSPTLFLGAIVGWFFGALAHSIFPDATGTAGAYALVGMGAMLAAITHAPITSIIMLFEITGNYQIILPLMAATTIATLISKGASPLSIYQRKLKRLGVDVSRRRDTELMEKFLVEDVMRPGGRVIGPGMPAKDIITEFLSSRVNERYVVTDDGKYLGFIALDDIKELMNFDDEDGLLIAIDVARDDVPTVVPRDSLSACVGHMSSRHVAQLPVVSESNGHFLGTISEHDIIGLYNREIIRKDFIGTLEYSETGADETRSGLIQLPHGIAVERVAVPPHLAGKTLKDANLRAEYGLTVVSIQDPETPDRDEVPHPDKVLRSGVHLVVVGDSASIKRFNRGDK